MSRPELAIGIIAASALSIEGLGVLYLVLAKQQARPLWKKVGRFLCATGAIVFSLALVAWIVVL